MTAGARFRLRGVSVVYGTSAALDAIDFEIAPGEAVALVGPSGAGKTTLLGLLNGTVRPTQGTVTVDDRDLSHLPPAAVRQVRAGIGFVHQNLSLVPNIRVLQNVLAGRLGRISFLQGLRDAIAPPRKAVAEVYEI